MIRPGPYSQSSAVRSGKFSPPSPSRKAGQGVVTLFGQEGGIPFSPTTEGEVEVAISPPAPSANVKRTTEGSAAAEHTRIEYSNR